MRFSLPVLAASFFFLSFAPAFAVCDATSAAGATCATKGETCMTVGGDDILACLATAPNAATYAWKSQTASSGGSGGNVGVLHMPSAGWDWGGTGKFTCDAGYYLKCYHTTVGNSNNAIWCSCYKSGVSSE